MSALDQINSVLDQINRDMLDLRVQRLETEVQYLESQVNDRNHLIDVRDERIEELLEEIDDLRSDLAEFTVDPAVHKESEFEKEEKLRQFHSVVDHLQNGNKIPAIKVLRKIFYGMGLHESKWIADSLEQNIEACPLPKLPF